MKRKKSSTIDSSNAGIAQAFEEFADLLNKQGSDQYRIRAYQRAASVLRGLSYPVIDLLREESANRLTRLPGIGTSLASTISRIAETGHWEPLDRLKGQTSAVRVFQTIPGIGPVLAHHFAEELEIESLGQLRAQLLQLDVPIKGVGKRRREGIIAILDQRLGARKNEPSLSSDNATVEPSVVTILEIDDKYRNLADNNGLAKIAPRRFNPNGVAWLPVMHERHGPWYFTVMYSNTRRAHEQQKQRDWVVVYFHKGDEDERHCTVVTEYRGVNRSKRVVRGREQECARYYSGVSGTQHARMPDEEHPRLEVVG